MWCRHRHVGAVQIFRLAARENGPLQLPAPGTSGDFWGGCTVTFEWFEDRVGSGRWGNQTPEPAYPHVAFPDRTLMRDGAGFRVVFGGTDFVADDLLVINGIRYLDAFDPIAAVPFTPTSLHPGGRHGAARMEPSRGVRRLRRCEVLDSRPADALRAWVRLESCRCHSPGWHRKAPHDSDRRNAHQGAARSKGLSRPEPATEMGHEPGGARTCGAFLAPRAAPSRTTAGHVAAWR